MARHRAHRNARPVRARADRESTVRVARQRGRSRPPVANRPGESVPPHAPSRDRASTESRPMITLLLVLATMQDTTIVIHPDSSSATLEARALPRVVSEEVIRFYNDPATTRLVGRTRLPRGNEWRGNVAVRNGPVVIAGRLQGTLVVINGDLLFDAGAEVTGNVIVVGGIVDDTAKARIGGEVRQYREPLLFRLRHEGDELVYAPNLRRRSEEHTSELQSHSDLVCRLLLEKKKK